MSSSENRRSTGQEGMVSILVTMLLLIVVSLIVLGFAQIARRNQRQSLDRQLSTQAFYAAETGINDVRNLIRQNIATGVAVPSKTDCAPASVAAYAPPNLNPTVDGVNNISYSCVMVDPSPDVLAYDDIGSTPTVVPLTAASGTISRLKLNWQSKDGTPNPLSGCPAASSTYPATTAWTCGYGVLRFDLVSTTGSLTSSGLQNATMTSFVVPFSSGGAATKAFVANTSTTGNNVIPGFCNNSECSLVVTVPSSTQYYLRVSSVYKDVSLQVRIADAADNPLEAVGAQAVIDATGRAQDVLRRVQVHVPLTASSSSQTPGMAIQSSDAVCKRFVTLSGFFQSYAAAAVPSLNSTTTPPNPLCQ